MRWRYPLLLIALSAAVFGIGLGYGVVMVGVPTQDPTPAVAAAESRDVRIAGWGMLVGASLFLLALGWLAVVGVAKWVRRPGVA